MNVRSICLAILFAGDTTGYDIRKASTDGHFSFFLEASFGSIYPALNKLEAEGLVTCRHEAQEGKPARKVYSITDLGVREFIQELAQPHKQDVYRSEFLLIALYCQLLGPEATKRAIDLQIQYLEDELALIGACDQSELHQLQDYDLPKNQQICAAAATWTQAYGHHCVQAGIDYLKSKGSELVEIASRTPLSQEKTG